mmetsp:Transcript_101457/g.282380  ORF Transcript_101457/g.282380 Transcript_101457/m.282380 type:complete len:214 (-) Transcript_101457:901-1542(-)
MLHPLPKPPPELEHRCQNRWALGSCSPFRSRAVRIMSMLRHQRQCSWLHWNLSSSPLPPSSSLHLQMKAARPWLGTCWTRGCPLWAVHLATVPQCSPHGMLGNGIPLPRQLSSLLGSTSPHLWLQLQTPPAMRLAWWWERRQRILTLGHTHPVPGRGQPASRLAQLSGALGLCRRIADTQPQALADLGPLKRAGTSFSLRTCGPWFQPGHGRQ